MKLRGYAYKGVSMEVEQIIKLIEVLAWPLTTLSIVSAFRGPILKLIARINAVEAGGVRAEFSAEMFEVRQIAEDNRNANESRVYDSKGSQLLHLAELSPNGAVVDAWREVELAIISAALHNNLGPVNTNYDKICAWKFQKHNSKSSSICCQYNEAT